MAAEGSAPGTGSSMDDVAAGQRMVIMAIVLYLGSAVLRTAAPDFLAPFVLVAAAAAILGILGLLRLADGLGYSAGKKALLVVLTFVPLAGFLMLLVVNDRATKALKGAGYDVGLLGAKKR